MRIYVAPTGLKGCRCDSESPSPIVRAKVGGYYHFISDLQEESITHLYSRYRLVSKKLIVTRAEPEASIGETVAEARRLMPRSLGVTAPRLTPERSAAHEREESGVVPENLS